MRSLIITHTGYQDQELIYPYYRLREAAAGAPAPLIVSDQCGQVRGILGTEMESHASFGFLTSQSCSAEEFDLLVIPGGVKAMEKLRQQSTVLKFVKSWMDHDKPLAATCSGPQLLVSADSVRGRRLTCYPAFAVDMRNAGAEYVDEPVVVDQNLVTSPHYKWLGEWMAMSIKVSKERT